MDMWRFGDDWHDDGPVMPVWVIIDGCAANFYQLYCVTRILMMWSGCCNYSQKSGMSG